LKQWIIKIELHIRIDLCKFDNESKEILKERTKRTTWLFDSDCPSSIRQI